MLTRPLFASTSRRHATTLLHQNQLPAAADAVLHTVRKRQHSPETSSNSLLNGISPSPSARETGSSEFPRITTRHQYHAPPLDMGSLKTSPIEQFSQWFSEAQQYGVIEPEAISLATVDSSTVPPTPSVRVVLLKQIDPRGFVFYTNYESRKGRELGMSPDLDKKDGNKVAGAWYWRQMYRSVRVVGRVERLSSEESYAYHATRPIGSQIGAHASPQSRIVSSKEDLLRYVQEAEDRFGIARGSATRAFDNPLDFGKTVPLPKNWGGVRIVPEEVEFWVGQENRLSDRAKYTRQEGSDHWTIERLAP